MSMLNIIAIFVIKPEFNTEFQAEFKKIVEGSRREQGCVRYDLNQDVKDPYTYVFIETWQSQQAIDKHNTELHYKNFAKFAEGKVAKKIVQIMKHVI